MTKLSNSCSVVVATTDLNSDIWPYFFDCLYKNWPTCDLKVYLTSQSKNIVTKIKTYRPDKVFETETWSERLKAVLEMVDTEFVLFMCDDYFVTSNVDEDALMRYLRFLEGSEDRNVLYLQSFKKSGRMIDNEIMERPKKCRYRLNCQVAIWRRKAFVSLIRDHETPWEFEILGSKRVSKDPNGYYCLSKKTPLPIEYSRVGTLIQGKWVKDAIIPLNNEYNWNIDFSQRGFNPNINEYSFFGKMVYLAKKAKKTIVTKFRYLKNYRKSTKGR